MERWQSFFLFRALRSFYFWAGLVFVLWIAFFDSNNFVKQYHLGQKLSSLKAEKVFYETEIERIDKDMKELSSDPEMLEKFVREKYMFQRKGEDIYLVEEEK